MQLTAPIPPNPKWIFLIFLFFFSPSLSDPQVVLLCGSSKKATNPHFRSNFTFVMDQVSGQLNLSGWSAQSFLSSASQIFSYAECYDFLSRTDCMACNNESRAELPRCFPADSGRIYLDGCYLRYDNYKFFEEALNRDRDRVKCGHPGAVTRDQYIGREFAKRVYQAVRNVTTTAARRKGFAVAGETGGVQAVYAMAQCWKILTPDSCNKCLSNAALKVSMCAPSPEGTVMNAGCYLRYSTENFSRNDTVQHKQSGGILRRISLPIIINSFLNLCYGHLISARGC